jgi:ubiquinone/menaquinone biosynthesis C-methylase UbiE
MLLDAQPAMLARAKERMRGPRRPTPAPLLADAVTLPFRDGSIDLVVSLGLLCCLTEAGADAAAREAWRVVRSGGLVALAVPRWRGAADEARHAALGFRRVDGGRPGRAVFQKPI